MSFIKYPIPLKSISTKLLSSKSQSIPYALRQQVWLKNIGEKFEGKCITNWCSNKINVFNYECGHNIPKSKGGLLTINNLFPICRQCNSSMGNKYTIDEWQKFK